jgi:hypothetical protein
MKMPDAKEIKERKSRHTNFRRPKAERAAPFAGTEVVNSSLREEIHLLFLPLVFH